MQVKTDNLDRTYTILMDADTRKSEQVTVHAGRNEIVAALAERFLVTRNSRKVRTASKPARATQTV